MMDPKEKIEYYAALIEKALEAYLPGLGEEGVEPELISAARHGLTGGKRFRPVLTLASSDAVGGDSRTVLPAAVAMEYIHTCSLILDDLPSMDNTSRRRGQAATHLVFGEATAILAAHALLVHAFDLLALSGDRVKVGQDTVLRVISEIASSLGVTGLIGGQYLDLQVGRRPAGDRTVETIHSRKTAALFVAAASTGAALSGASEADLTRLRSYAENLGRAFQHIDDLIDSEDRGTDNAQDPRVRDRADARRLTQKAKEIVQPFGKKADTLLLLADVMVRRRR